jgi:hypothetical protein
MIFKTMKQEEIRKALEGHTDILRPVFEANEKFFKALSCPECRGDVLAVVNTKTPFKEGSIVPNCLAKCKVCGVEFEPHTGIQVTLPSL